MDKRILGIVELVQKINEEGGGLTLTLNERGIFICDGKNDFEFIIPHWTKHIYFSENWCNDYDEMVECTLEVLRKIREELIKC